MLKANYSEIAHLGGNRVARSIRIIQWTSEMVHYSLWLTCSDQNVIRHSFGRKDNYNYCSWMGNGLNTLFSFDDRFSGLLDGNYTVLVWWIELLLTSFVWCKASEWSVLNSCCVCSSLWWVRFWQVSCVAESFFLALKCRKYYWASVLCYTILKLYIICLAFSHQELRSASSLNGCKYHYCVSFRFMTAEFLLAIESEMR